MPTNAIAHRTAGSWNAYRTPSRSPSRIRIPALALRAACSPGISLSRIRSRALIEAKKVQALSANAQPVPIEPSSRPPSAGPIRLPSWNVDDTMLIAFRTRSLPTSSVTKDCLVGLSTAVAKPRNRAIVYTCQTCTWPVNARVASTAAAMPIVVWVQSRTFRFGKRSAIIPPNRPSRRVGRNCSAVVMPTAVALPVIVSTSQSCAMRWIQPPVELTSNPLTRRRKLRTCSALKVSLKPGRRWVSRSSAGLVVRWVWKSADGTVPVARVVKSDPYTSGLVRGGHLHPQGSVLNSDSELLLLVLLRHVMGGASMYDPDQLRTFLAVAQSLSFTQAADRLGIRQPTVSQHVRKLEVAVGRPLFVRDTRTRDADRGRRGDGRVRPDHPGRARGGGRVLHRLRAARPAALRRDRRPGAHPAAADPARLPPALPADRPRADRCPEPEPAPPGRVRPPGPRVREARRRRRLRAERTAGTAGSAGLGRDRRDPDRPGSARFRWSRIRHRRSAGRSVCRRSSRRAGPAGSPASSAVSTAYWRQSGPDWGRDLRPVA